MATLKDTVYGDHRYDTHSPALKNEPAPVPEPEAEEPKPKKRKKES